MRVAVICGVLLAVMMTMVVFLAVRKRMTAERLFSVMAVPLALIYLLIFPPWTVPDAGPHFSESYRVSNLMLGTKEELGRAEDVSAFEDHEFSNPAASDWERMLRNIRWAAENGKLAELPYAELLPRMNWYSPLNYLPQAIGLTLGRLLGLGGVLTLLLARALGTAAYLWMAWRAVRIAPVGKYIFALVPLLPMSLMLGTSFSYDAMVLGTALGLTASLLRLRSGSINRRTVTEAAVWVFLAGGVKGGGNLLLMMLALSLPLNRIRYGGRTALGLCEIGLLSLLLFDLVLPGGQGSFQLGVENTGYLYASWALSHPGEYLGMVIRSYLDNGIGLALNMGGTYLAWLEETIPHVVILAWMLLIGVFGIWEKDAFRINGKDRGLISGMILCGLIGLPTMMLSYTPVGSSMVEGLQGRYYSFLLPSGYLALTKWGGERKSRDRVLALCGILAGAASVVCVAFMLNLYCGR